MATYINYGEGEDDATVQAAEWLRNILRLNGEEGAEKEFYESFREMSGAGAEEAAQYDYGGVFDLFVKHSEELFSTIPENRGEERVKEVESFFAVVMSLLLVLDDVKDLERSTTKLCDLFTASSSQQPELRLRLLMMLYNTFNNPAFEVRYRVFKTILDYSAEAGQFDQVAPYLENLDSWMVDWDPFMTPGDKRTLFLDISKHMRKLGKRTEAFQYLKRHVLLYQGSPDASSKEAQDSGMQLIQDTLQLQSVMQVDDILALDVVKTLGKKAPGKDLVALLNVFLTGNVEELSAFHKKNGKLFKDYNIVIEDAMSKIRLLTLATLCQGKSEVPLTTIAKVLHDEDSEGVERWVVKAISEGVIDGRIDQLNHKLLAKSTFQRKFERGEWEFLGEKLNDWVNNLENLIQMIGQQKLGAVGAAGEGKMEDEKA